MSSRIADPIGSLKFLRLNNFKIMLNRLASYSDTEKKTVMICDDERDLLELFGKALQTKYNIILVGSGEDLSFYRWIKPGIRTYEALQGRMTRDFV